MSRSKKPSTVSLTPSILAGVQARLAKMNELQEEMTLRQNELEWFLAKSCGVDLVHERWTLDLEQLRLTKES